MSDNPWAKDRSIDKSRGILLEEAKELAASELLLCETHKLPVRISDDETSLPGHILVKCVASKVFHRPIPRNQIDIRSVAGLHGTNYFIRLCPKPKP